MVIDIGMRLVPEIRFNLKLMLICFLYSLYFGVCFKFTKAKLTLLNKVAGNGKQKSFNHLFSEVFPHLQQICTTKQLINVKGGLCFKGNKLSL